MHIKSNKIFLQRNITPKYATVKISNSSKAANKTRQHAEQLRIKEERTHYTLRSLLNTSLFELILRTINYFHPVIVNNVLNSVAKCISITVRHTHLNRLRKLRSLELELRQEIAIVYKQTFYHRVMHFFTIKFDKNEMKILNKGANYNLPPVDKNKLIYEVVEAERDQNNSKPTPTK